MKKNILIFSIALFWLGCKNDNSYQFREIETPSQSSGESNLFASENNEVYLSWVEYLNDTTDALLFSKLRKDQWSEPIEIARGTNWFVNWADFPSIVAHKNNRQHLAAHWLQKSAGGTYDYDVRIAQSKDGGNTWGESFIIHRDSIAAEHGFATMIPLPNDRIFATWLDGRNTKIKENSDTEGKHHGAMTLRTAEFDIDGNVFEEAELDNRICDCCQTDAAMTSDGMIVVYRDRSEHEIRDISIVRKVEDKWTTPNTIHADNWEISGCPVNGPAVDALESLVAVTWFTGAQANPSVKVAFSKNSGETFNAPIQIDDGNPLGRVDVVLISESEALVTWVENTDTEAEIRAAKVSSTGKSGDSFLLTKTSTSRSSGFPVLAKSGDNIYMSWTMADSLTKVQTAVIKN
jgi:glycerophosphoryl diester phosphodiesterase